MGRTRHNTPMSAAEVEEGVKLRAYQLAQAEGDYGNMDEAAFMRLARVVYTAHPRSPTDPDLIVTAEVVIT